MPVAQVHRSDIAACGRRDVSLPRSIQKGRQKDEEARLTWHLKYEVMRGGRVYCAKLARCRSMFVARRLISHFAGGLHLQIQSNHCAIRKASTFFIAAN